MSVLLEVDNLQTQLHLAQGNARVVDHVSFTIGSSQTLALVGESGCGKTMTAYSILRLLPSPPASIAGGRILFNGENILDLPEKTMRHIRGGKISMIFQEPLTSLNPVFRVGSQIAEVLQVHKDLSSKDALEKAVQMLRDVGIPSPEQRIRDYPHQMSGGMRQRVMIAIAIACNPQLLIADEPTTALDVTVQAQIMELLHQLKQQHNMALLLITHDLGVVAEAAGDVAVMYAGRIVEYTDVTTLFAKPCSPYTQGLLNSLPRAGVSRLKPIRGMIPSIFELPKGCKFSTRCDKAFDRCMHQEPELVNIASIGEKSHFVRCWLYQNDVSG
ncbi:MAG: ABC transporter ATP-binding protein [Proteobacteria bacterium]|nr:ABC transporter ATP-binding protein [Pseudomonadota bacterium]